MQRRRMVVKRFDPWSVLKFSFLLNLAMLAMLLLAGRVVWFAVRRLELIETVCDQASQILDLTDCGIDGGGLFQNAVVLGLFGVVVMTGFAVFFAFLLNLISDLTGGLGLTIEDDGDRSAPPVATSQSRPRLSFSRGGTGDGTPRTTQLQRPVARPRAEAPSPSATPVAAGATAGSLVGATSRPKPPAPPAEASSNNSTTPEVDVTDTGGEGEAPLFDGPTSEKSEPAKQPAVSHAPVWRPEKD